MRSYVVQTTIVIDLLLAVFDHGCLALAVGGLLSPGDGARQAMELLAPPIPRAVALAAAPALVDVMATVAQAERKSFDRSGLLLARLLDEAAPEPAGLYGAAFEGERFASFYATGMLAEAFQSPEQPLTREDAGSYVCWFARDNPATVRGLTAPFAAAGCLHGVDGYGEFPRTPPHPLLGLAAPRSPGRSVGARR